VDLLGYIRQESGNKKYPDTESAFKAKGRNAQALLLGGLYALLRHQDVFITQV